MDRSGTAVEISELEYILKLNEQIFTTPTWDSPGSDKHCGAPGRYVIMVLHSQQRRRLA